MGVIKNMIKTWLDIKSPTPQKLVVYENKDFKTICAINRVWLRGDSFELAALHKQLEGYEQTFWGSIPTAGMEMKHSHSGIPAIMVSKLADIVISDYNGLENDNILLKEYWKQINTDNSGSDLFEDLLEDIIVDTLAIGDGAIRFLYNPETSQYPFMEWISGENVDLLYKSGKLYEIDFHFYYEQNKKKYHLIEKRGYGYINYELYDDDLLVPLSTVDELKKLKNITFDKNIMLAVPIIIKKSKRVKGRGSSLFEGKYDAFDSLDEVISQWLQAIRSGRPIKYIPESLCPKNPDTGEILIPNPYDNQYFQTNDDMSEEGASKNKITVEQPEIPTENYLQSYITYLDLCLQGIISPATLGIDNKKVTDANASYERQLEKTTMHTRNKIINALNIFIPKLVNTAWQFKSLLEKQPIPSIEEVKPKFGEYNSPSYDAQIETMGKARINNVVSIETMVDELYGDSKTDEWKNEEVIRLKNEAGITEMEEPSVSQDGLTLDKNLDNEMSEEMNE